jgi:hypothetical protein
MCFARNYGMSQRRFVRLLTYRCQEAWRTLVLKSA